MNDSRVSNHRMQDKDERKRLIHRAFTLIELVASLTILSSLLVTTVSLVTLAQKSNERVQVSQMYRQQISRFARTFRNDLRGLSVQCTLDGNDRIIIDRDEERITYHRLKNSVISRVVEPTGKEASRADEFDFGPGAEVNLSWSGEENSSDWIIQIPGFSPSAITVTAGWRQETQ